MPTLSSMDDQVPLETKVNMDRDYDYYVSRYNTSNQQSTNTPPSMMNSQSSPRHPNPTGKYHGNLGVMPMEPVMEQFPMGTPPKAMSPTDSRGASANSTEEKGDGDEALLDLAQLEELHHEAERMKALGNKHMAAQEYTRAYNAYSAALQLSPVGPSSHVFLSNRSAALLSLKRYSAAATDAKRAIALAPTFGKAHARLGQALYFLKDYEGAVAAYEDAIHYEPDSSITRTYLEKAKAKCDRQKEKHARSARGEEVSVLTENSSLQATITNSVATDPNAQAAVVQSMGFRGQSQAMSKAVGGGLSYANSLDTVNTEDDPDFEEALRIQERANRYLASKNYRHAIEEYTAALFLVPDDYNLSPDLHLGRAHALNGSRRHDSAKIDAELALKIKPSPEAYSTLAKSLFYLKDYQGAIEAFGRCKDMLPEGESLSMFDRAYLQKSEAALDEVLSSEEPILSRSTLSSSTPVPKLRPPRFVPREEALNRTPNIPPMPRSWPQQTARDTQILRWGPEREVLFLSEALGIKLNRGPDGIVRVIDVSPETPGSPIVREGKIYVGDVIREAAGVDLRRPITNIMWGDTVALIKMAPRPIVLVVAAELTPETTNIAEQRKAAATKALSPTSASSYFPSNSSGDESVKQQLVAQSFALSAEEETIDPDEVGPSPMENIPVAVQGEEPNLTTTTTTTVPEADSSQGILDAVNLLAGTESSEAPSTVSELPEPSVGIQSGPVEEHAVVPETTQMDDNETTVQASHINPPEETSPIDLRDEEQAKLGKEIFFRRNSDSKYIGWDNLRWMSYSGSRKLDFVSPVYRFFPGRRHLFWSGDQYLDRILAAYSEPHLILILKPPEDMSQILEILDLPEGASPDNAEEIFQSFLIVESVVDPITCKLKLSPLTTITSVLPDVAVDDFRRRSCFELITPTESIVLSAVRLRKGAERVLTSFTDSGAFLETTSVEHMLQKSVCDAHSPVELLDGLQDLSWRHQIILGTLHSHVVLGNLSTLDMALAAAKASCKATEAGCLEPRVIDLLDQSGRTPLHYACSSRFSSAVSSLVKAGANVDLRVEPSNMTPCHLCALHLDSKSMQTILAVNRRPNVVDTWGRTPIYVAIMDGRSVGASRNPEALDSCVSILEEYGGQVEAPQGFRHPVSALASSWSHEELAIVLKHVNFRYPLVLSNANDEGRIGISMSAFFQYPVHSCLIALRKQINVAAGVAQDIGECNVDLSVDKSLLGTLEVLFNCGFEPNERLEGVLETFDGVEDLLSHTGFAPIQILAAAALDARAHKDLLTIEMYMTSLKTISSAMDFLVRNGAKLSLDAPPTSRSKDRRSNSMLELSTAGQDNTGGFLKYDPSLLKLQTNQQLLDLMGSARLASAEKTWAEQKSVPSTGLCIFHTDKLAIENAAAPGGSDVKSCSICWKAFGAITNRKHRCRISRRHVCDECSSKRIVEGAEEHRVSDGQFLLARADLTELKARKQGERTKPSTQPSQPQPNQKFSAATGLARLEAEEASNRDSLFGNVMDNVTRAVFGEEDWAGNNAQSQADSIEGLSQTLNETRNKLLERGDKLNTLADKSDRLVNASKDFATMAKELNRKSQGGFFW